MATPEDLKLKLEDLELREAVLKDRENTVTALEEKYNNKKEALDKQESELLKKKADLISEQDSEILKKKQ